MDIGNLCSSGETSPPRTVRLGRRHHNNDGLNTTTIHEGHVSRSSPSTESPQMSSRYWKVLFFWKKLKRDPRQKTASLDPTVTHSRRMVFPYDPCSYSRNFDRGFAWDDHDDEPGHEDNLSRSFSFRFSDPNSNVV